MRIAAYCFLAIVVMATASFIEGRPLFKFQPSDDATFRVHPLGMKIYNMSGSPVEEKEWKTVFSNVAAAHNDFLRCLGERDRMFREILSSKSIVLIPGELTLIFHESVGGFTNMRSVFLRRDAVTPPQLRHQWIHLYLFLQKKSIFRNITHQDELFWQCGQIHDSPTEPPPPVCVEENK